MNDPYKGHGPEPPSRLVKKKGGHDAHRAEKDPLFCIAGMEQRADQRPNEKTCECKKTDQQPDLLGGLVEFIEKILVELEEDRDVAEIEKDDPIQGEKFRRNQSNWFFHLSVPNGTVDFQPPGVGSLHWLGYRQWV